MKPKKLQKNIIMQKELEAGVIAWYDFRPGSSVLYVGDETDGIALYLKQMTGASYDADGRETGRSLSLTTAPPELVTSEEFIAKHAGTFACIICMERMEKEPDPVRVLAAWKRLAAPGAVFLAGVNNRLGTRFVCGDRDLYTERSFDGIENYRRAYRNKEDVFAGRMYTKEEWEGFLSAAGVSDSRFYSAFPGLHAAKRLYLYGSATQEDLPGIIIPEYGSPETVFLEEEALWPTLEESGMLHQTANAYLIEIAADAQSMLSDAMRISCSMQRGHEAAVATVLHADDRVTKRNIWPEGADVLDRIEESAADLRAHGLETVELHREDGCLVMPVVRGVNGQCYLKRLLKSDPEAFYRALDQFRDCILHSSDNLMEDRGDGMGALLARGYFGLLPENVIWRDGVPVFFGSPCYREEYSANILIIRAIHALYAGDMSLSAALPMDDLLERYDLFERKKDWMDLCWRFWGETDHGGDLWEYYADVRRNPDVVNSNRQSINYSSEDYYRLFVDIFRHADTRKLILFGSGKFAKKFLDLYGKDYPPAAIVDNREENWGEKLEDIEISSPEILKQYGNGEIKVIVCIKNYLSVMKQLAEMGVTEVSIYDPLRDYPRKRHPIVTEQTSADKVAEPGSAGKEKKKYHTGYISGVWDLFHVGHLNIFKRAKEQCEYLIVGVVSDKGVIRFKGVAPFVPFEERIELVRACRYVDEAVEIPVEMNGPKEALAMYHFDVQFQGSDHMNEDYWIQMRDYLREHGADMVFFPYTMSTNSTNIKKLIEKKLV